MSELGTFAVKQGTVPYKPLPAKPIPPLLLQAYRALRDSRNYTPGPSVEEAIAAIEAEYPGVKEKA